MAFQFTLQAVLRLRRSLENQEEKKLMAIASAMSQVRHEMERLDESSIEQQRAENEELVSGASSGAVLQFYALGEARRRTLKLVCAKKLVELERKRKVQANEYRKARQGREILESLRSRQQISYERHQSKKEQERLDEAFLMRKMREEQQ